MHGQRARARAISPPASTAMLPLGNALAPAVVTVAGFGVVAILLVELDKPLETLLGVVASADDSPVVTGLEAETLAGLVGAAGLVLGLEPCVRLELVLAGAELEPAAEVELVRAGVVEVDEAGGDAVLEVVALGPGAAIIGAILTPAESVQPEGTASGPPATN